MWNELVARWYVGDFFQPTDEARRYYEIKHRIVARLQPASICEIGVRAGYSAFAFLTAVPGAEYLGIDKGPADPNDHDAVAFTIHAQHILGAYNARMWPVDSQGLGALPKTSMERVFEFVHVDADHSYRGCRHDLEISLDAARWVLVDDFDVGPEIRKACSDVLLERPSVTAEYVPDGFRGNLLLTVK